MVDLFDVADSAELSCNAFLCHQALKEFLIAALPNRHPSITQRLGRIASMRDVSGEKIAGLAMLISAEWTKSSMARDSVEVDQTKMNRWARLHGVTPGPGSLDVYLGYMFKRCARHMFDDSSIPPIVPERRIGPKKKR